MNQSIHVQHTKQSKLIFGISALILILIVVFKAIDIYKYAFIGAVFEMLWLFIIAGVFIIPIVTVWGLFKNGCNFKSFYFFAIVISVVSLIIVLIDIRDDIF